MSIPSGGSSSTRDRLRSATGGDEEDDERDAYRHVFADERKKEPA
jgi:hypothetical protein